MRLKFENILLAFIFIYPITPWYITFGPLNLVNIVSMIFIAFWIVGSNMRIANFSRTNAFFWIYLLVYSVQALIDTSLVKAIAYIIAQLTVCLIVYTEMRKRKIFVEALHMLVYAAGILSVIGLVEEVTRTNIFHTISRLPSSSFYTEIRLGIYRIETSFSHPIVYCAYLCFIAGLLNYLINNEIEKKRRRIFRIIYILVIINALLTMSRSTLFVLLLEQMILGYMTGGIKFSKKILLALAFLIFILVISSALGLSYISKIKDIWYMFLAIFNDNYSSMYSTSFGMNESGIGNRLELFTWVADAVKGHELFGMGTSANFAYSVKAVESTWNYSYTWTKTSIENEYLYNYFIHGLVGILTFVLNICGVIIYAIKTNKISKPYTANIEGIVENKMTFPKVMTILLIGYGISLFSVRSSDNVRMFNILICILFTYNYKLRGLLLHEKRS